MIALTANDKKFTMPQMWGEITWKQWKAIQSKPEDLHHIASVLSGLQVNDQILSQLMPFMAFMNVPFDAKDWKLPSKIMLGRKEVKVDVNIRSESFAQKVLLQYQVKSNEIDKAIMLYLSPRYIGKKFDYDTYVNLLPLVDNLPLCEAFPVANFFLKQLRDVIEMESKELSVPHTSEQVRAGIGMFNEFGINNTIDALAHGDVLRYEQILQLNYNVVFLKLKRTKIEGKYRKNYDKIMAEKK